MSVKKKIAKRIRKGILVLDGATGTELLKRGMPSGVCPELWCLENPDVIKGVHADYREAGSDVVYTCTFGANRIKLSQYGIADVADINRRLAHLAREAVGDRVLVAGDIAPMGQFVKPYGDLAFDEAVAIFKEQILGLVEGGVDCLIIETMMDIQEARAALIAARETCDLFTMVTMTYELEGRTLNGTDPVSALITLQSLGADAVGCNCSTGPHEMVELVAAMKPFATVPLIAKPNAGMPQLVNGETVFNMPSDEFAACGREFVAHGVNILGGCCGTGPDHIRALKAAVADEAAAAPVRKSVSAVSSAAKTVIFGWGEPLRIIGERINPTGKPQLQEELREGRTALVRKIAREQERMGADLLDVNVGMPGIDEEKTMEDVITLLSVASALPLVVDSADAGVIERALRVYPGRAVINSITAEKVKMRKLLPVAARYGALVIVLPVTDKGVPEQSDDRIKAIKKVYETAREYGLTKDDIIVDGLVMTVSSSAGAPMEALKTVEWASRKFRSNTLLGLTNVSFGMPQRKWLNATYLAMAMERGLTVAIANPEVDEVMNCKVASDVLIGRDPDASHYISRFTGRSEERVPAVRHATASPSDQVFQFVLEGNRDDVEDALSRVLETGMSAQRLVQEVMISAITKVGELYDRKEYFLPQLIASAEAMKKGLAYLDPYLRVAEEAGDKKGRILIATVQGDMHDIGKNIVSLMLGNYGFEVVDLGKDISAERIAEEARRVKPDIIALSALMTTTMVNMQGVLEVLRSKRVACDFMVGGAVVTESYASAIGAHYAKDGVEAVSVAEALVRKTKSQQ